MYHDDSNYYYYDSCVSTITMLATCCPNLVSLTLPDSWQVRARNAAEARIRAACLALQEISYSDKYEDFDAHTPAEDCIEYEDVDSATRTMNQFFANFHANAFSMFPPPSAIKLSDHPPTGNPPSSTECCANCTTTSVSTGSSLPQCSRCKAVRYCTTRCQKEHWRFHKGACVPPK
jgi:hypothetical protein